MYPIIAFIQFHTNNILLNNCLTKQMKLVKPKAMYHIKVVKNKGYIFLLYISCFTFNKINFKYSNKIQNFEVINKY